MMAEKKSPVIGEPVFHARHLRESVTLLIAFPEARIKHAAFR